jgi:PAS domain S-box-containing protein
MGSFALGLLVVLIGLGVACIVVSELNGAGANHASRATIATQKVMVAMEDQDAGVWGYVGTRQAAYLGLYWQGRALVGQALAQLQEETKGTSDAAQVARVSSDVRDWQAWAEGVREQASMGGGVDRAGAASLGEHGFFDRFQTDVATLLRSVHTEHQLTAAAELWGKMSLTLMVGGSVTVGAVLVLLVRRMERLALDPVLALAATARQIASGEEMSIPFEDREDEIAELAGALRAWHDVAAERAIVSEQAPVGICRLDLDGRVTSANPAVAEMFGYPVEGILGRHLRDTAHPDDQAKIRAIEAELADPNRLSTEPLSAEARGMRADGSLIWCSAKVGPLRSPDGRIRGSIVMLEDITVRKQQSERAAQIQRDLWPQTVPELEGYDLAGACRPALDVAGDMYDWSVTPDGDLDLTVADVMGKGIGAALVMATLRASLRSAPVELGPAERLRLAADSASLAGDEEGLFVTVFMARLRPATGELRYVDAGHGYCTIRRANGDLAPLSEHSLPVWVEADEEFREGRVVLQPGETLVVHSDGLVELSEEPTSLQAYSADLDRAADATDAVSRLLGRMPAQLPDDVTVLVLRRLAEIPTERRLRAEREPVHA